jgi:hypothetical protein
MEVDLEFGGGDRESATPENARRCEAARGHADRNVSSVSSSTWL